jgi:hypothetical protein
MTVCSRFGIVQGDKSGAKGNKGASTRLHQSCAFMQFCEEFSELASLLAAKVNLSRSASADVSGARIGRPGRGLGAAASLHDCYSLSAKLHTVFTPPTISYSNFYASGAKVSWPVSPARRCSG